MRPPYAPGMLAPAMAFATEISAHVKAIMH
jgi:hypothetical protein